MNVDPLEHLFEHVRWICKAHSESNKTYISMPDNRGERCLDLRRMWV